MVDGWGWSGGSLRVHLHRRWGRNKHEPCGLVRDESHIVLPSHRPMHWCAGGYASHHPDWTRRPVRCRHARQSRADTAEHGPTACQKRGGDTQCPIFRGHQGAECGAVCVSSGRTGGLAAWAAVLG